MVFVNTKNKNCKLKIMAAFDKLFLFKPGWRVGVQDNYCKPFIAPVINDPVRLNIPHVNTLQLNKPFLFFFFEECNSSHFKKGWYIIIILLQSIRQMIITHFLLLLFGVCMIFLNSVRQRQQRLTTPLCLLCHHLRSLCSEGKPSLVKWGFQEIVFPGECRSWLAFFQFYDCRSSLLW